MNQFPTNPQVWIGSIYEEKGGHTLFHVFAGGNQVCTFETNSVLFGGTVTTNVGYYYHEDNLNSSAVLSSGSLTGTQLEVNVYYPFGRQQVASPQASFKVSRQFTGQVKDDETGLYYLNARYYDEYLARFIQADTIIPDFGNPQSYNRYSYCLNDPLRYTDPTGHAPLLFDKEAWGQLLSPAGQWAHNFFLGGQYPANNERVMLRQEGIQQWTPLTDANGNKLGNPATAVVKAGGGALLQAGMMVGPMGEEKAAATTLKEGEKVAATGVEDLKTLFHGTDSGSAKNIVANGINKGAARNLGGGDVFWATEDKDIATLFAQANPKGGSPAVVAFKLPTSAYDSLVKSGAISVDKTGASIINDWDKFNKAVINRSAQ